MIHYADSCFYETDILIVGGGISGICAAIQAARLGLQVTLLEKELVLGGNSSSLFRLALEGAGGLYHEFGRETGIIEELEAEAAYFGANIDPILAEDIPVYGFKNDLWSLAILKRKCEESGVNLFLKTAAFDLVKNSNNEIKIVKALDLEKQQIIEIKINKIVIDASGDGIIAYKSGAEYMIGQESKHEYNESYAPEKHNSKTMGDSLIFMLRDTGRKVDFTPPPETPIYKNHEELPLKVKVVNADKKHAGFSGHSSFSNKNKICIIWTAEYGGHLDILSERKKIYDELLKMVFGIVDHIKNQGDHGAENYELFWVSPLIGRREGRRYKGDYILTQNDILNAVEFEDGVAYGGRPIDIHQPEENGIFTTVVFYEQPPLYNIPYRCLYSKNIPNLMLAGRIISGTRIALGSYRVQKTLATIGQAVGAAVFLATKYSKHPRSIGENHIEELQQLLLKEDATILNIKNKDVSDHARYAKVYAESETNDGLAINVINGIHRRYSADCTNMWISNPRNKLPQSITLDFNKKISISSVHITFDTSLDRIREENINLKAFKETVRDYSIQYNDSGKWVTFINIEGNYYRKRVHSFKTINTNKIKIVIKQNNFETDGITSNSARIYEIRVYS